MLAELIGLRPNPTADTSNWFNELTRMPWINPSKAQENLSVAYKRLGYNPNGNITEPQIKAVLLAEVDILRSSRLATPLRILCRVTADEQFLLQASKLDSDSDLLCATIFFYGKAEHLKNQAFDRRDNPLEYRKLQSDAAVCLRVCRALSNMRIEKYPPPKPNFTSKPSGDIAA